MVLPNSLIGVGLYALLFRLVGAWAEQCSSYKLPSSVGSLATLTHATYYAAGDFVNVTSSGGTVRLSTLPAFCRIQLVINTDPANNASALSEVWLPDAYDGRFIHVGNGGWSGGVVYSDLAYGGIMNNHAAASTDGGHESNSVAAWATPASLIDYAYRAVHDTVTVSKMIVGDYYSDTSFKSYWFGCSTGGRQGLMSAQKYPDDFDGIVVGSPANWISHLQSWSIHINLDVLPVNGSTWIPAPLWTVIHNEVLKQCDALDGVVDGILNDPRKCFFRPEAIACRPGQNASTCLSLGQIGALRKIYADYYETNQTYIFAGYQPGGELAYPTGLVGMAPFSVSTDYFKYMVLNDSTWDYTTLNYTTIQIADAVDTYRMDAVNPDIRPYVSAPHNGKVIHYVGWADQLISPGNSVYYYEQMSGFMTANTNATIDDFYRLFTVPGMQHCSGGAGANAFGGAGQASGGMPPGAKDASHDVLRAIIAWVEDGVAPNSFIATKYVNNNASQGVSFTRPICKFPQEIIYKGSGSVNDSSSFYCQ